MQATKEVLVSNSLQEGHHHAMSHEHDLVQALALRFDRIQSFLYSVTASMYFCMASSLPVPVITKA